MKKIFNFLFALLLFAGAVHAQTTDDSWWYDWNGRMDIKLVSDDTISAESRRTKSEAQWRGRRLRLEALHHRSSAVHALQARCQRPRGQHDGRAYPSELILRL